MAIVLTEYPHFVNWVVSEPDVDGNCTISGDLVSTEPGKEFTYHGAVVLPADSEFDMTAATLKAQIQTIITPGTYVLP